MVFRKMGPIPAPPPRLHPKFHNLGVCKARGYSGVREDLVEGMFVARAGMHADKQRLVLEDRLVVCLDSLCKHILEELVLQDVHEIASRFTKVRPGWVGRDEKESD